MTNRNLSVEKGPDANAETQTVVPTAEPSLSDVNILDVIKSVNFTDLSSEARAKIQQVGKDLNDHNQFVIKSSLDLFKHTYDAVSAGTAIYEKMIVLNGATIALSITLLGSLSARLAAARIPIKPHIWMVSVAWSLLIVSIFCCYRVIIARNSGVHGLLATLVTERTRYNYSRLGVLFASLGPLLKGNVKVGDMKVETSKAIEALSEALKAEGDQIVLKSVEKTKAILGVSKGEAVFARIAIYSTMVSVALLCLFTILSLRLFF